jgi:2-polyprenyl-3-methyl-5-hydroxy-6-metoxy-1,4-benzoquinol methylase
VSVQTRYRRNYDQIARDHVEYAISHRGQNPFQGWDNVQENNARTVELVGEFVPEGSAILEVGCGIGDLLQNLGRYVTAGLDIAQPYVDECQRRGLSVFRGAAERTGLLAASFDCVIAADLLEHVLDVNKVVKECLRVLRKGGVLVVRTPDSEHMEMYVDYAGYEYIHLRSFQPAEIWLLFTKIFPCEILALEQNGQVIHAAVRK